MATDIPIEKVIVLEIKCSFCNQFIRVDAEKQDEDLYGQDENYRFRQRASRENWAAALTRNGGMTLTLCPDHKHLIKDLEL